MLKLNNLLPLNSAIGIFGGGQLGKMLCFAAHQLGYRTVVFSNKADDPAVFVTNQAIIAEYNDRSALIKFASLVEVATLEFENIPVAALELVERRSPVYPKPDILRITQNRLQEKDFLNQNKIATTNYLPIKSLEELKAGLWRFDKKAMLKTAFLGYDGKGQIPLNHNSSLGKVWQEYKDQELILEQWVEFDQEISVIAVRNKDGEVCCYEPLTNIHKNSILSTSIYPSHVSSKTAKKAMELASLIANKLELVGIIAVEFFVLKDGELLVNELAPRPHNSGHFTLDGCYTSQFEQLIRVITGMPFGNVQFHSKGYMQNLLGDEINEVPKYLADEHARVHLYGKSQIKPGRKMGHVNFLRPFDQK